MKNSIQAFGLFVFGVVITTYVLATASFHPKTLSQTYNENIEFNKIVKVNREISELSETCLYQNYVLGQRISQEDPCLVATFQQKLLVPPPPAEERLRGDPIIKNEIPTNNQKLQWIEKLLIEESTKQKGFFIECGANDGFYNSATLHIEARYNWTGLLIEANRASYLKLLEKKRNAWTVNAAACPHEYPAQVDFFTNPNVSTHVVSGLKVRPEYDIIKKSTVQCIPLYTMLKALQVDTVDYLNLDVEGFELDVLKTLPWDKVKVRIMTVEHWNIPGGRKPLQEFMESKGYKFVRELQDPHTKDTLIVHPTLYEKALRFNSTFVA